MVLNVAIRVENYRKFTKKLHQKGCRLLRETKSSHKIWINPETNTTASIPDWGAKDSTPGIISSTLKQLQVDISDL